MKESSSSTDLLHKDFLRRRYFTSTPRCSPLQPPDVPLLADVAHISLSTREIKMSIAITVMTLNLSDEDLPVESPNAWEKRREICVSVIANYSPTILCTQRGLKWQLEFLQQCLPGWHAYFWISFIPLILLLTVGTKLEHIITQLAHDVAEKNTAIEGDLVVKPSDDHFWFHRPRIVPFLIHVILFQNAFEIAYFFFILVTYGYHSCIMDSSKFIIPRVSICVIVQVICSYSTLPLYAIVTQMGSSFKPAIFEEHVQEGLVDWAQKAKLKGRRATSSVSTRPKEESIQLQKILTQADPLLQESRVEIVEVDPGSNIQDKKQNNNHKS